MRAVMLVKDPDSSRMQTHIDHILVNCKGLGSLCSCGAPPCQLQKQHTDEETRQGNLITASPISDVPLLVRMTRKVANPFPPYSLQKRPETPNFCPKFVPAIVLGVPVRGTEIWKNLEKFVRKLGFFKFLQILPNFSPPDWNPPKQSLGQILDKFAVSGVFEGCKGEKGSQEKGGLSF